MAFITEIRTDSAEWNGLYPQIREFFKHNYLDIVMDGKKIRGYRSPDAKSIWIRDHSDMMRCFKYFEADMQSCVDHFADTQAGNGRIFDYYTVFPEKLPGERENWAKYVRVPVEADVEYRFVKAAFLAWQAAGDDAWIKSLLPAMEKAMHYVLTHPWRWDEKYKLVKRAYTVDTWDFAYSAGQHPWLQMQIDENTFWGIMHGDISGYYEAFLILARLCDYFNQEKRAAFWAKKAAKFRKRLNKIAWNGRFYTHFVKLTPVTIDGVDESEQLSLSNPMAINRGIADHRQAVAILQEYRRRKQVNGSFAEWYSIDPPFPDGILGDDILVKGAYCNGGIMPLVGGELARAAFEHGFEEYGVAILQQYRDMIAESKASYLWYFPDGKSSSIDTSTSPDAMPTDGWGSGAMGYAFIEGLAGVVDHLKLFRRVTLSPRWLAAQVTQADVRLHYPASQAAFAYDFQFDSDQISLNVETDKSAIRFHVLLPEGAEVQKVVIDRVKIAHEIMAVEKSRYVDFHAKVKGKSLVKIVLA
jgi:hypothetical protein